MKTKRVISFTEPQERWLVAEAKKLDISVPELVRRLIDQVRGSQKRGDFSTLSA